MTVAFFCRQHPHSSAGHTEAATALVRQARKERCDTNCADNIVICLCQFPLMTLFIHRDRYRYTVRYRYRTGTYLSYTGTCSSLVFLSELRCTVFFALVTGILVWLTQIILSCTQLNVDGQFFSHNLLPDIFQLFNG